MKDNMKESDTKFHWKKIIVTIEGGMLALLQDCPYNSHLSCCLWEKVSHTKSEEEYRKLVFRNLYSRIYDFIKNLLHLV